MRIRILWFVTLLLFLVRCSAISDQPNPAAGLEFLYTPQSSHKLIVFVHGVFGGSFTWTNRPGESWPELMKGDLAFRDYALATYSYDSRLLGRTSTIQEISTRMLRELEDKDVFRKYKEIYFITHSMGGLVTKRVLLNLNSSERGEKLRQVKAVMYIATPAQGADSADIGTWFSLNPQLRDLQSADFNSYLQNSEDEWGNLMRQRGTQLFPRSFCAYETKSLSLYGKVIVTRTHATTICDDTAIAFDENHISIVKPLGRQSATYEWARSRIQDASDLAAGRSGTADNSTAIFMECQIIGLPIAIPSRSTIYVIPLNYKRMQSQNWGFYQIPNHSEKERMWPDEKRIDESKKSRNPGVWAYRCEVSNEGSATIIYLAVPLDLWFQNGTVKYRPLVSALGPAKSFSFYIVNDCAVQVSGAWQDTATVQLLGEAVKREVPLRRKYIDPTDQILMFFPTSVRWAQDHPCE